MNPITGKIDFVKSKQDPLGSVETGMGQYSSSNIRNLPNGDQVISIPGTDVQLYKTSDGKIIELSNKNNRSSKTSRETAKSLYE